MDVGVIGVGAMGRNHVRVYSELRGVDSLGIYDVNTQAAKENIVFSKIKTIIRQEQPVIRCFISSGLFDYIFCIQP